MGDVIVKALTDPVLGWHLIAVVGVLIGFMRLVAAMVDTKLERMERKLDAMLRHERLLDKLDADGNPKPQEEINTEILAAWNWSGEPRAGEE